jgi:hypothetical protein
MKTYLVSMYFKSLADAEESVRQCQDAVKSLAGNDWKLIRAGVHTLGIVFTSNKPQHIIQKKFIDPGRRDFQILVVELSAAVAGWIDPDVYKWIETRLAKG